MAEDGGRADHPSMVAPAVDLYIRAARQGRPDPDPHLAWPDIGHRNALDSHILLAIEHGSGHEVAHGFTRIFREFSLGWEARWIASLMDSSEKRWVISGRTSTRRVKIRSAASSWRVMSLL